MLTTPAIAASNVRNAATYSNTTATTTTTAIRDAPATNEKDRLPPWSIILLVAICLTLFVFVACSLAVLVTWMVEGLSGHPVRTGRPGHDKRTVRRWFCGWHRARDPDHFETVSELHSMRRDKSFVQRARLKLGKGMAVRELGISRPIGVRDDNIDMIGISRGCANSRPNAGNLNETQGDESTRVGTESPCSKGSKVGRFVENFDV